MPHLFVTRPRLHDLLAGDQERARHFRWETINAIVYSKAKQANCVIDKLALPEVDTTSPEIIHIVEPEAPSHSSPVKPFNGQVINIVEPEPVAPVQHGESAASSPVAQFNGQVIDIVDPSEMPQKEIPSTDQRPVLQINPDGRAMSESGVRAV